MSNRWPLGFSAWQDFVKRSQTKGFRCRLSMSSCVEISESRILLTAAPVGLETQVNTHTVAYQEMPDVAMDDSGNYVVVWSSADQDSVFGGIYGQRYSSSGLKLGAEFQIHENTLRNDIHPKVAMDADGDFVVVWTAEENQGDGAGVIYYRRYTAGGIPLSGESLVDPGVGGQSSPSIAMDDGGNFVITWDVWAFSGSAITPSSSREVFVKQFNFQGSPVGGVSRVNGFTAGNQIFPVVAMDADGDFVIAWSSEQQDGDGYGVYARRFSRSGATVGAEFRVNSVTLANQIANGIAMDAVGNFVVCWGQVTGNYAGGESGVFIQRFNSSGVKQGAMIQANSSIEGLWPDVAMNADGRFVVTWVSESDLDYEGGYDVQARVYQRNGVAEGDAFFVNSVAWGLQLSPAVACDYDGDFLVVWEDGGIDQNVPDGRDGSLAGVFHRRYRRSQVEDVGVSRIGKFYIDINGNQAWDGLALDSLFSFGGVSDTPLVGDWNGDGYSEVGVYRGSSFYLDMDGNRKWDGPLVDRFYTFGLSGDQPIVGDWDGNGKDEVGVWRQGTFYLDLNGNGKWDRTGQGRDGVYYMGKAGDVPISGDWNGDGFDDIGIKRGANYYLDLNGDGKWVAGIDKIFSFGALTDMPVIGDWNGDGIDDLGVWRSGKFYLDSNGNRVWEQTKDRSFGFGATSDMPLVGHWRPKSLPSSSSLVDSVEQGAVEFKSDSPAIDGSVPDAVLATLMATPNRMRNFPYFA